MIRITNILILFFLLIILLFEISENSKFKQIIKNNLIFLKDNNISLDVIPNYKEDIDLDLLKVLQKGNNSIFIRHSHKISKDFQQGFDILQKFTSNRSYVKKNNCLTLRGKEEAYFLGKIFRDFNIPINKTYTSPICRCEQTANIAFKNYEVADYLMYESISNKEIIKDNRQKIKNFFYTPPPDDMNNIFVGHGSTPNKIGINIVPGQSGIIIFNHDTNKVIASLDFNKLVHIYYLK